jgi:tRNA threonylcarbamoyladenosine biosynthesis protein TsaB
VDEPILAIEGGLGVFSVALLHAGRIESARLEGKEALEGGLGVVVSTLRAASLRLSDLGGLAVGTGPGGFTGLRIAISYAKSLALGAGKPLVGVSSFDVVDAAANADERTPRLTIVSGRAGIICVRRTDSHGTRVACGPIEPTLARVMDGAGARITVTGATEDVRSAILERETYVEIVPSGEELPAATLARIALARPPASSLHAVAPDYGEIPAVRMRT